MQFLVTSYATTRELLRILGAVLDVARARRVKSKEGVMSYGATDSIIPFHRVFCEWLR